MEYQTIHCTLVSDDTLLITGLIFGAGFPSFDAAIDPIDLSGNSIFPGEERQRVGVAKTKEV